MRISDFWDPQFDQNLVNPSFAQTQALLVSYFVSISPLSSFRSPPRVVPRTRTQERRRCKCIRRILFRILLTPRARVTPIFRARVFASFCEMLTGLLLVIPYRTVPYLYPADTVHGYSYALAIFARLACILRIH
jgi:hypothetical protein